MLKVNVVGELSKNRKDIVENPQLKEAQLLLEGATQDERNFLSEAGLDTNLKSIEAEVGVNLERGKFEEKHGEKFYTEEEIKAICVKYKLRFLQSNRYKGVIPPELGARLANFFKEKKIDGSKHEANSNLFIMAPAKVFNLEEVPKPPRVQADPLMFWKVRTNEGTFYTLIHKWGNDFSITRRALGIIFENPFSYSVSLTVASAILMSVLLTVIGLSPISFASIIASVLFGGAVTAIQGLWYFGSDKSWLGKKYYSKFTPVNWNSGEVYN